MSEFEAPFPEGVTEPEYELYGRGEHTVDVDPARVFADLNEEDAAFRERARAFALDEVAPVIDDYWDRADYPLHLVRRLGELDLLRDGVQMPGRTHQSRLAAGLVNAELSRIDSSVGTILGVQGGLALRSIMDCGSPEQIERWAGPMADGTLPGAFALTEPTHGSDSVGLQTSATKVDGGWVLNGEKKWIGNGSLGPAKGLEALSVVWARDGEGNVRGFAVPQDSEGYSAETITGKLALRAIWQAHITMRNVFVPDENLLPGANSFKDTSAVLFSTRLSVAWGAVGAAMGAYETAVAYARQREQFGRPLAASQIVNERLARMQSELVQIQLLARHCVALEDRGELTGAQASLAKFTSTRTARSIAANARDLLGGNGILIRNRAARTFADVEALHTYEGTETVQALLIGRSITGHSTFTG
jgi:glutaryl-CoA dehydrogenase